MMTDAEWKILKDKIEKEFPIRIKLAQLAGRPKINIKNYKELEAFDDTVAELFLEIALNRRDVLESAIILIKELNK